MFDSYVTGQKRLRPRAKMTLLVSFALHATVALAMLLVSFWRIEKVPGKDTVVSFGSPSAHAVPAAPAAAAAAPALKKSKRVDKKPRTERAKKPDTTQPVDTTVADDVDDSDDADDLADSDDGDDAGTLEGVIDGYPDGKKGGIVGGDPDGVVGGDPNGSGPGGGDVKMVPERLIRGRRIAGDENIYLPKDIAQALFARGVRRVNVTAKMCLSRQGIPTTIKFLKSTGYPQADHKLEASLRKWRYQPFRVRGQSVPICTVVFLNYTLVR